MKPTRKLASVLTFAALSVTLAACAGSGERHFADDYPTRYYDGHPSHFDSDVYYDPTYNLRGDGEFRPRYKLKSNN